MVPERDDDGAEFGEEATPTNMRSTEEERREREANRQRDLATLSAELDATRSQWQETNKEIAVLRQRVEAQRQELHDLAAAVEERNWILNAVKRLVAYLGTWLREIESRQKARDASRPPQTGGRSGGTIPPKTEPK